MLKKVVKTVGDKKVLFYYLENKNCFEVISIIKHGENSYSYWMVDMLKKDINLDDIEDSLYQLIYHRDDYINDGFSSLTSLEGMIEETVKFVPTIEKDIHSLGSSLLVIE